MAKTIREKIISAYKTQLANWNTANGYNHDCGLNASRAKSHIEEKALPACVLWPGEETAEKLYGKQVCTMSLKVDALAIFGKVNPSIIQEQLLGDVIKNIMDPTGEPAALIEDILYTGGSPADIGDPEKTITAITAKFEVKYKTRVGDPYTQ